METRTQRVVIETAYHRIVGDLTLAREGYQSRISDFLNQTETAFVSLTNAKIVGGDPPEVAVSIERDFIVVGTAHIQFVYPADEAGSSEGAPA